MTMIEDLRKVFRLLGESGKVDISQFENGNWTIEGPDSAIRSIGAATRFIRTHAEQIERDARDAERWRHVRYTAFREFDSQGMWLRFAAIRHYEGRSDRLNERFVDSLVDQAIKAAMSKDGE